MEKAHKRLVAWRLAMDLAHEVYEAVKLLPPEEKYALSGQMRRAAVSVPSNIAEGAARVAPRDALHFFIIARASLSELDTQVTLCAEIGLLPAETCSALERRVDRVDSLLSGLIRHRRSVIP